MFNVIDFVAWALTHVKRASIPSGAELAQPPAQCGTDPWHYLFGSHGHKTTRDFLEQRWINYYQEHMSRAKYDSYTAGWLPTDTATDCQGLCDAYWTYEQDTPTDINADMNYKLWCEDKGRIAEIDRPFVIGEALFRQNSAGKMTHVGWICGFDGDEPLVVEAKGIAYGVLVTRFSAGSWTHRGLMTKVFDYTEEKEMVVFEVTSPMHTGDDYRAMQVALNAAGYTDADDNPLEVDGKWGNKSQQAFDALIADYAETAEQEPAENDGSAAEVEPKIMFPFYGYTVCVFDTDDLPFSPEV